MINTNVILPGQINLKSHSIIFACLVALNDIVAPSPCDLFQVRYFIFRSLLLVMYSATPDNLSRDISLGMKLATSDHSTLELVPVDGKLASLKLCY